MAHPPSAASFRVYISFLLPLVHCATFSSSAASAGFSRYHRDPTPHIFSPPCDLFSGIWIPDHSLPLYNYSCPVIDPEFNCQLYGRPDSAYLRYRWKPAACDIPNFDGVYFLEKMRGKTVMFVGDSLGRNQWESLICMLQAAVPLSPAAISRGDPLSSYKFMEYEVTVSFFRSPYLVDINVLDGKRVLMLDEISENGRGWIQADVLSFNSGHWWTHRGALQGWDYVEVNGALHADVDRVLAFQTGLTTWAKWIDLHINRTRTRVFFQSLSPTHYNPSEWKDPVSKNCYGETAPATGSNYTRTNLTEAGMMRVVPEMVHAMQTPARLLDITQLSELRKDCHPSIYSGDLSPLQRAHPDHSADCSHWCLPGLPDTWNQLFYALLFF